ncbi:hypothetical protein K432DRAFT_409897 [Lepidopterella palustris CBS 459.81]|uniref:Heterokaryon incompatibility domain-containing protein n=1 Tax=Lepidopterella palustris CBS 459.81 TaxID=1314670 RepID=A0A8E2DZF4_9PEZI|nr:hypothetical protein K432DRAFT_409897 [Lepidopterella palustris CBS 459.81]
MTLSDSSFITDQLSRKHLFPIYYCALAFAPQKSLVRNQFQEEMVNRIKGCPQIVEERNALVQTLRGHTGSVKAVVFSRNGKLVTTASDDGATLKGHSNYAKEIIFSPNGKLVASALDDGTPTVSTTVSDDTRCSLATLRAQAGKPLYRSISEIYANRLEINKKSIEFLRSLKCFLPADSGNEQRLYDSPGQERPVKIMLKPCLSAKKYVAVSYPWTPSNGEGNDTGKYQLPQITVPLKVRDIVLDRTISFIQYKQGPRDMIPLWIDRLSMDQDNADEQKIGIQSMDLVYKRCTFAVGYLWVEIKTQVQVDHLSSLIGGRIVEDKPDNPWPALERGISTKTVYEVLRLLVQITNDQWWSRAWIFQEDYLAGTKMWLLIRHAHGLHKPRAQNELGNLLGELVVKSEKFRKYATLFCLACYQRMDKDRLAKKCDKILRKAGKYNILHKYRLDGIECNTQRTMTVSILKDLNDRKINDRSDFLAITANACGYDIRTPTAEDSTLKTSLSLSILTLYISNGEMIKNDHGEIALGQSIFDFLESQSISISAPLQDGALTFIKHCRLSVNYLSPAGIHTKGILWKLSEVIRPERLQQSSSSMSENPSQGYIYRKGLNDYQQSRLRDLLEVLNQRNKRRHRRLANDIAAYLKHQEPSIRSDDWPPKFCMNMMAARIVNAMDTGKYLQLARPIGGFPRKGRGIPYRAVFIRDRHELQRSGSAYIFTSWTRTEEPDGDRLKCKKIAKYVSMEVSVEGTTWDEPVRLRSKGWTNGLCFFDGEMKFPFAFAWPESFCQ